MGDSYASVIQRGTISSTTGTSYYVKLRTFIYECHIFIFSDSHNLQIRVFMDQLANVIPLSGVTGAAAATINYANLVCKVLILPLDVDSID